MVRSLIFVFLLFSSYAVNACQCFDDPLEEKVSKSDYIYLGMNIQATLKDNGVVENILKPIEVFKGTPDQWLLMSKGGPVKMCSAIAAVGLKYIVYGRIGELPKLSLCSYSYHFDSSNESALLELREAVKNE
jgi:hypothetical protein